MNSRRKLSSGPSTKYQWLHLMREFNKKHEDKCKILEIREPTSRTCQFLTGSFYTGEWKKGYGMHGYGVYTFNNGVIYEGEFCESMFHGKGELRYQTPDGEMVIRGHWDKGLMTDRTVLFDDALEHDAKNWHYCEMPDRRFTREYIDDVQPSGKSFMTAKQPYEEIPERYFDTGSGFFDPVTKMIYQHDDYTLLSRAPGVREQKWIQKNCRIGKQEFTVGPRQDLYEKYMDPKLLLEPVPSPPAKFIATRHHSTWELYLDLENTPSFYNPSKYKADARSPE